MAEKAQNKDPMTEYVIREFERYERYHADRFARANKIYDKWRGKAEKRSYDWQNAVHKPLMMGAEQTISPRLFSALFPDDAPVDCRVEGDNPEEAGRVVKSALQHYFRVSNVQGHIYPGIGQATLLGTGYMEAGTWLHRKGWTISETGDRVYTLIESRPDAKFVSYFEMFPNPDKMYMWDNLPIIRRRFVDAEHLKSLAENPNFKFTNLAKALKSESPVSKASVIYGPDGKLLETRQRDQFELLEYWGPYDYTYEDDKKPVTKKAVPHWIIVVNRSIKVRAIPNPYNHQLPPFIKLKLFEDIKPNWFGVGVGDAGLSSQERVNKLINQRLDNVDLVLNKQGVYDGNDNMINTKSLGVSKPGKWHKVQDVDRSMKPFEFHDVTASSYQEEKLATEDFRESTGAVVPLQPDEKGKQHRTAMGIQLLQSAAGVRFKPVIRMMEVDGIQQIAQFFYSNLHQFMTRPQLIMLIGEDVMKNPQGFQLKPEHLQAKVFFFPTGLSETMNKELQIGQLLRFKEITMNDPTVNRMEINKRIAHLFGFKDIEKLLVQQPPPQMQPGALPDELQQKIRQRVAEGADPETIKNEILGPAPSPQAVGNR